MIGSEKIVAIKPGNLEVVKEDKNEVNDVIVEENSPEKNESEEKDTDQIDIE